MNYMKKTVSSILALALILTNLVGMAPLQVKAAAPSLKVSNAAVTVNNGETTSVTITIQNYTKSDFDVAYNMSAPGIVAITQGAKDVANRTVTLNITGLTTGATGVVVYLTNNLSSYVTFTVASKNKVVKVEEKKDKDKDDKNETKDEIDGYKIRYDKYVYGDHGEKARIRYCDIIKVNDTKKIIIYTEARDKGKAGSKAYFKANFYDKNDKLISTKYKYEKDLDDGEDHILWWDIPSNTYKIKFEE